eukprot:855064-Alexandrium_andersonii.AAC.1
MRTATVQGAWAKALGSIAARAVALASLGGSPSLRATHWSGYIVSCTLYPSHIAPPDGAVAGQL